LWIGRAIALARSRDFIPKNYPSPCGCDRSQQAGGRCSGSTGCTWLPGGS